MSRGQINTVREVLAVLSFSVAIGLLVTLFADGFEWWLLVTTATFFAMAHMIWPSKKQGQRRDDYLLLNLLEFIIELPVNTLLKFIQLLGRVLGSGPEID